MNISQAQTVMDLQLHRFTNSGDVMFAGLDLEKKDVKKNAQFDLNPIEQQRDFKVQ
jgi:hypothetical protein